ncbi:AraC family transcriptional regulator [Janthinobacterium fluminis]|uniref:AraC family transcriptional regulator n=1 Tax=Janthinobacterium fluminis TaxID=2987524 RepID=A0ABT5JWM0_9BURK|nr:AraC family transcriptional regulator [Janthinobacterium fluminis]MDC8757132.1 AraC family transcriptional regulator [Janthinobacterium fluminis]
MTQTTPTEPADASGRDTPRRRLAALIDDVFFTEPLFDLLPDVVFFVKDLQGRYVVVNQTLANRCGLRDKAALLGRRAADVFPAAYAGNYHEQDQSILAGGPDIRDRLELHLYPDRDPGWCMTQKMALRDHSGRIVGLSGISRDLNMPDKAHPVYGRISAAADHIRDNYEQAIQLSDLARIAGLSASQIERYFQRIFHLTPRQMIIKTRLDAATALLAGRQNITDIAIACGYHDHSAFTRQFKEKVGLTPSDYRAQKTCKHPWGQV